MTTDDIFTWHLYTAISQWVKYTLLLYLWHWISRRPTINTDYKMILVKKAAEIGSGLVIRQHWIQRGPYQVDLHDKKHDEQSKPPPIPDINIPCVIEKIHRRTYTYRHLFNRHRSLATPKPVPRHFTGTGTRGSALDPVFTQIFPRLASYRRETPGPRLILCTTWLQALLI